VGYLASGYLRAHASAVALTAAVLAAGVHMWSRFGRQRHGAPAAQIFEEQFQILFDRSPDMIVVVDPEDARIVKANRAAELLLDRPADSLVGQSLFTVCPARAVDEIRSLVQRANTQGAASRLTTVVGRDGGPVAVGAAGTAFPWGRSRAVLLTFRDIRERLAAEQERARLEATLRAAAAEWTQTFDALSIAVLLVRADGVMQRLNQAARTLAAQHQAADPTGRPLAEMGGQEPWHTAVDVVRRIAAGADVFVRSTVDPASARSWNTGGSAMVGAGDGQRWAIVTMQETTQVVALEDALRRSERMAEIGTLISGVAHEVRNPLFAISGGIETLAHDPSLPATAAPIIELLREPLARLGSLMHDLLEYARPSARERTSAPLEKAAASALRECELLARLQDVRLVGRWPEGLPPVSMDLDRMVQAFQNVLQNAIQHSPRGGTVEMEMGDSRGEGGLWLVCAIRDAGPGFEKDILHRAFEPLLTRRPGGTGLGLCIARNVVEEHGGRIGIGNLPTGGACVTIRLPAAEAAVGATSEAG